MDVYTHQITFSILALYVPQKCHQLSWHQLPLLKIPSRDGHHTLLHLAELQAEFSYPAEPNVLQNILHFIHSRIREYVYRQWANLKYVCKNHIHGKNERGVEGTSLRVECYY